MQPLGDAQNFPAPLGVGAGAVSRVTLQPQQIYVSDSEGDETEDDETGNQHDSRANNTSNGPDDHGQDSQTSSSPGGGGPPSTASTSRYCACCAACHLSSAAPTRTVAHCLPACCCCCCGKPVLFRFWWGGAARAIRALAAAMLHAQHKHVRVDCEDCEDTRLLASFVHVLTVHALFSMTYPPTPCPLRFQPPVVSQPPGDLESAANSAHSHAAASSLHVTTLPLPHDATHSAAHATTSHATTSHVTRTDSTSTTGAATEHTHLYSSTAHDPQQGEQLGNPTPPDTTAAASSPNPTLGDGDSMTGVRPSVIPQPQPSAASGGGRGIQAPAPSVLAAALLSPESSDRRESAEFKPSKKRTASMAAIDDDDESDDEGSVCPICFEEWSTAGPHRITSLKCGHLFGKNCIEKWLKKGDGGRCPQCNAKAKKADMRLIFTKNISAVDTTGAEAALRQFEGEAAERKRAQQAEARVRIENQMLKNELQSSRTECDKLKKQMACIRSNPTSAEEGSASGGGATASGDGMDAVSSKVELMSTIPMKQKNGRVMAFDQQQGMLVHSAESTLQTPFAPNGSAGLVKISTLDYNDKQYVAIHTKTIRDVRFCPDGSGMVLTVGLDKKAMLTNLTANTVVQSYTLSSPAWTCCWASQFKFYCGLTNHSIVEFDTRNTRHAVQTIEGLPELKKPMVALHHLNWDSVKGLLSGSLGGTSLWAHPAAHNVSHGASVFQQQVIPELSYAENGTGTWLATDDKTQTCMVSTRRANNCVLHTVGKLSTADADQDISQQDSDDEHVPINPRTCQIRQQICGAQRQRTLSRSALSTHPLAPGKLFALAGDELLFKTKIWDVGTGQVAHDIPNPGKEICLDMATFESSGGQYMLCTLTGKNVHVHNWTYEDT